MNDLKPYDVDNLCAKCGQPNATTHYIPSQGYEFEGVVSTSEARIERECRNCGYEWCEKPLDEG